MLAVALQIDSLGYALFAENMMTSPYPFGESQIHKKTAEIVETDIRI